MLNERPIVDADTLEFWIDANGFTKRKLNAMLGFGRGYIEGILRGTNRNPVGLPKLAKAMGVPIDAILRDAAGVWVRSTTDEMNTMVQKAASIGRDYLTLSTGMDSYLLDKEFALASMEEARPPKRTADEYRQANSANVDRLLEVRNGSDYVHRIVSPLAFVRSIPNEYLVITRGAVDERCSGTSGQTTIGLVDEETFPAFRQEIEQVVESDWSKVMIVDDLYMAVRRKYRREATFHAPTIRMVRERIEEVIRRWLKHPFPRAGQAAGTGECNEATLAVIEQVLAGRERLWPVGRDLRRMIRVQRKWNKPR